MHFYFEGGFNLTGIYVKSMFDKFIPINVQKKYKNKRKATISTEIHTKE